MEAFIVDQEHSLQKAVNTSEQQETLKAVRHIIVSAQREIYTAVNFSMVNAYWSIGKHLHEVCGGNERSPYGKQLFGYLSEKLTAEFGKGFDESNLRNMRRFYRLFPIQDALRPELSWTHYRSLMKVSDETARNFYMEEAVRSGWSSRQLDRQINSFNKSLLHRNEVYKHGRSQKARNALGHSALR